jgi:DNA-binding GntR family transcriptional regulator
VREIFELRYVLESAMARLAASRADPKVLDEIRANAHFTYTYRDRESYTEFLALNSDFHRRIADSTGNGRLASAISQILDELTRVFHLGLDIRDSAEEMKQEHVALAEALCDRDPDRAARIVQDQVERSQERILQALIRRHADLSQVLGGNDPIEALSLSKESYP